MAQTCNQGIVAAKGEYVCFVNAGDLWHPDKLQKQIFCLDHYHNVGITYVDAFEEQSKYVCLAEEESLRQISSQYCFERVERSVYSRICLSSVMIRHRCFEVVGLFDPQIELVPDWDLWLRLSHYYPSVAIAQPLVYCRHHLARITENFAILETDLQTIIEKAYRQSNYDLRSSKSLSYALASLFLAATVLQRKKPDLAIANNYCSQALEHHPSVGLSAEFFRLRCIILASYCFKGDRHRNLWRLVEASQNQLENIVAKVGKYAQKFIHWMLEEEESFTVWRSGKVDPQGKD